MAARSEREVPRSKDSEEAEADTERLYPCHFQCHFRHILVVLAAHVDSREQRNRLRLLRGAVARSLAEEHVGWGLLCCQLPNTESFVDRKSLTLPTVWEKRRR